MDVNCTYNSKAESKYTTKLENTLSNSKLNKIYTYIYNNSYVTLNDLDDEFDIENIQDKLQTLIDAHLIRQEIIPKQNKIVNIYKTDVILPKHKTIINKYIKY